MDDKTHILVVDDDDRLRHLLRKFLSDQGFMVSDARNASEARQAMQWFSFDAAVFDVMMPGESGLQLLASLPQERRPPVLMLSAMGETEDRIRGLEKGADDYLAKPFEPKELVLRLKTILRRRPQEKEMALIRFGEFVFDMATSHLSKDGHGIYLTSNETALLKLLGVRAGAAVSREELARLMPSAGNERSVDVQVTRLRKKIEPHAGKPVHLQTVRGAGYVLYAKAEKRAE